MPLCAAGAGEGAGQGAAEVAEPHPGRAGGVLGSGLSPTVLSGHAGQCLGSVILESGMLQVSGGCFLGVLLLVLLRCVLRRAGPGQGLQLPGSSAGSLSDRKSVV